MELTRFLLEGAGAALLAVAVFFLYTVSERLAGLAGAVSNLQLEIAKEYVTKAEHGHSRTRLHDLAGDVGMLANRVTIMETMAKK